MDVYIHFTFSDSDLSLSLKILVCVIAIFSGHDVLVNVFALGSRLGLAAGWTAQAVMTIEQYPTVIRSVIEKCLSVWVTGELLCILTI